MIKLKHKTIEILKHISGARYAYRCLLCGTVKEEVQSKLKNKKSCGCLAHNSTTHGMTKTRFYRIWKGINGRCYTQSNWASKDYLDKGIRSEWRNNFLQFKEDMYASYLQHVKEFGEVDTTIERNDPKKDYSEANCSWATRLEQANNRSDTMFLFYNGQKKSVRDWARETGLKYETLRRRILVGWKLEDLFNPIRCSEEVLAEQDPTFIRTHGTH